MAGAGAYEFDHYLTHGGTATEIEQGVNFDSVDYCNFTIRSFYDNGSLPVTTKFYMPYDTYYIYADTSDTGNCGYGGQQTYNNDADGKFEHEIQHDNVTRGYQLISSSCDSGTDFTIEIVPTDLDSEGYYSGMYRASGGAAYPPTANKGFTNTTFYPPCTYHTYGRHFNQSTCSPTCNEYSWTPFVAGYNETRVQVTAKGAGAAVSMRLTVYPLNDPSTEIYNNFQESATVTWDQNFTTLEPDTTYVVETATYVVNPSAKYNFTVFKITTLDADPDWSCTDWSDCDDETDAQERTCSDNNGIVESYLEYRTCEAAPEEFDESVYLGFRNITSIDVPICIPNWTVFGCVNYVVNKTVYVPANWDLISTETLGYSGNPDGHTPYRWQSWVDLSGFHFKMWTKPPKPNEAWYNYSGTNQWECINITSYSDAYVRKNVTNSTLSSEFNITFPADNMQFWFQVKKCPQQQYQYNYNESITWFGWNCGDLCYSSDCADEVQGLYNFKLINRDNGDEVLLEFQEEALDEWRTFYFDVTNLNLTAGTTYTIQLWVHDDDYSVKGTCLEFRDFGYGISDGAFECEDYCSQTSYHYFKAETIEGICVFQDQGFDPNCVENQYVSYYENCENFCDEDDNYHIGSNLTGECLWSIKEDSDLCEEITSEYDTLLPSSLATILQDRNLKILLDLTSVFGIITLAMAFILMYGGKVTKNIGGFLIGGAFIVMFLVRFGYFPALYAILILAGIVFLLARSVVDVVTGK